MFDRRQTLIGIMGMFGAQVFAPIARAANAALAGFPAISDGPPSSQVFTSQQRALMTALSECVMPTTDTPGAIAAGVPDYIEKLLADWSAPADREPILAGLDAIEAQCRSDYGVAAATAKPEQLDALLTLAMDNKLPGGGPFFTAFRQMVITGYFTSEIGMTEEREYLPVPGHYDGAYLYSNVNKVFSA